LLKLCDRYSQTHATFCYQLNELIRSLSDPNLYDIQTRPHFMVEQWGENRDRCIRLITITNSLDIAYTAFHRAIELYPSENWMLCDGGRIMQKYPDDPVKKAAT
jgi:hypothetical protein